jgi:transcriptional regulator with XRE-family HTH domain
VSEEAGLQFAARLKIWRETAGLSQRGLDRAMGYESVGYTAQLETGRLLPPDKETSARLEVALSLPEGAVWRFSAPLRLARLDPDLYELYGPKPRKQHGGNRRALRVVGNGA